MQKSTLLDHEILDIFEYKDFKEFFEDTLDNEKTVSYVVLADILNQNKDVLNSLQYFSSVVSGRETNDLKSIVRYIKEIDAEEDKVMELTKNIMDLMKQETMDVNKKDVFRLLDFKTQDSYENYYSKDIRDIAYKLVSDIRLSYSLKLFSQYTTNIEHDKITNFLDYLNLTFKEDELKEFNGILERGDSF